MIKRILLLTGLFLLLIFPVFSEENTNGSDSKMQHIGFIFSAENILLDLNDYNGGVGMKMAFEKFSLRLMADFGYSSSAKIISGDLGASIEKRFRDGRISPYVGGGLQFGIEHETVETDSDNWTKQLTVPSDIFAFLGIEVFLLEFLSVFAEYNVAFTFNGVSTSQSVDGIVTDSSNWNWDVSTGLGNSGRLGIVIYLEDVVEIGD